VQRLPILVRHLIIMCDDKGLVCCGPYIQLDLMDAPTDGALKGTDCILWASKHPSAVGGDTAFGQVGFRGV
jgi:hypothetical protein